jgi:hypothetical protein
MTQAGSTVPPLSEKFHSSLALRARPTMNEYLKVSVPREMDGQHNRQCQHSTQNSLKLSVFVFSNKVYRRF